MTVRKCSTCKHYEPAPIWRKGWCRNPLLYSPQQSHLVGEEDLDCDRGMGNYWEPLDGSAAAAEPRDPDPAMEANLDAPRPVAPKATPEHAQPILMKASRPPNPPEGRGTGEAGEAGRSGSGTRGDTGPFGGSRGGDTGPFGGSRGGDNGPFSGGGDDSGRGGGLSRFTRGGKSGGGGSGSGGGDDDDPNRVTPPPREPQRPAGTPERQFSYYTEQRYWTDYFRIAAPVLGVILILGLVWFWLGSLMDGGQPAPTPSPSPTIAATRSSTQQSPLIIADPGTPTPSPASSPRVAATPDASKSPDTNTFVFAKGDKAVVGNTDGHGANLRAEPSSDADIVTVLHDGMKLDITGDSIQKGTVTWWPVTTPDGDKGYISEDFLKPFS